MSAWRRATSFDITCSNNLIYEGLGNSVHATGEHSRARWCTTTPAACCLTLKLVLLAAH
jgi:hypothetical protein